MKPSSRRGNNGQSYRATEGAAIRIDACYDITPERIFNAWLDPDVAGRWLFATAARPIAHVEIDARVGGLFRFVEPGEDSRVEHTGAYIEVVPPRRLVFSLALGERPCVMTRVSVEIEPREIGCRLSLIHENVPLDLACGMEARWTGILYGLDVTLDSFAGVPMSKRRPIAPDAVLRRLAFRAPVSREFQPPRNPRSE